MKTAGMVWPGRTLNLSPYGVKVAFDEALRFLPETNIRLQLALPDHGSPLALTASVVRLDDDGIALNFVDPEENTFRRLKAFVDSLLTQG